jgi:hypothetical protein
MIMPPIAVVATVMIIATVMIAPLFMTPIAIAATPSSLVPVRPAAA